jgi:thiol:disulfide interchange protein
MRKYIVGLLLLVSGLVGAQQQFGGFGAREPVVKVFSAWSATGVKPGGQIALAVILEIKPPYHVNPNKTKEPFIPTKVEVVSAPPEIRTSTPIFPEPHEIDFGPAGSQEKILVLSGRTVLYVPMAATSSAKPGQYPIEIKIGYQACDDKACLFPTDVTHTASLNIVAGNAEVTTANGELFKDLERLKDRLNIAFFGWDFEIKPSNFAVLLLIAMIGGMLLNFTPCVLPLIPIKIMGLSRAAGNRRRCVMLGATMSFGVVVFWLALAAAISTISGFNATNKLFQYPAFTITVGLIICVMAIGMCGLFSARLPQWVYRINPSQESLGGSFLFGIMTAVLSTPCTAPFMGAAAAWSATQAAAVTLSTFAAIGLGMALPYLALAAFPGLASRMPRSGPASDLIKHVMGLLMLAAGAYFLGTGLAGILAKPPDPPTQAYWWLVAFFVAAAGGWLAWRTLQITPSLAKRFVFIAVGVALVGIAGVIGFRFTRGSPIRWTYYTPERLDQARTQKNVIVLEFTAAWCLNCHALEQAVLHDPRVVKLLNSDRVSPIKVDLTGNNPAGDQKLLEVGRRSIPYLVIYGPDGTEVFASDAYTVEQVVTAIEKLAPPEIKGASE